MPKYGVTIELGSIEANAPTVGEAIEVALLQITEPQTYRVTVTKPDGTLERALWYFDPAEAFS